MYECINCVCVCVSVRACMRVCGYMWVVNLVNLVVDGFSHMFSYTHFTSFVCSFRSAPGSTSSVVSLSDLRRLAQRVNVPGISGETLWTPRRWIWLCHQQRFSPR